MNLFHLLQHSIDIRFVDKKVQQTHNTKPDFIFPAAFQPFLQISIPILLVFLHKMARCTGAVTDSPAVDHRHEAVQFCRLFFTGQLSVADHHSADQKLLVDFRIKLFGINFIVVSCCRFCNPSRNRNADTKNPTVLSRNKRAVKFPVFCIYIAFQFCPNGLHYFLFHMIPPLFSFSLRCFTRFLQMFNPVISALLIR